MKHNSDHGNPDHNSALVCQISVIPAEPPMLIQPCRGSLNRPPARKKSEPPDSLRTAYGFRNQSGLLSFPSDEPARIRTVGRDEYRTGKTVIYTGKKDFRTRPIPNTGTVNSNSDDKSGYICDNMTPASVYVFTAVIPAIPAYPGSTEQIIVYPFPCTVLFPFIEITIHTLPCTDAREWLR